MKNAEKPYQFGHDDFVRYHKGMMSAEEMNQLEKAALDDPFLQDALDGYAHSANHQAELDEINTKLHRKNNIYKNGLLFKMNKYRNSLSIAASIIVIVFTGYILIKNYNQSVNNNSPLIAKNEPKTTDQPEIKTQQQTTTINPETIDIVKAVPAEKKESALESVPTTQKMAYESTSASTSEAVSPNAAAVTEISEIKEAPAPVTNSIQTEDDQTKKITADADTKTEVQTAVVMSSATLEKRSKAKDEEVVNDDEKIFQTYVTKNKNAIKDINGNLTKGKVVLNFDTDKRGKPVNIKVTTSLSEACDKEAVRLLKSGPKWSIKNSKDKTAVIEF